MFILTAISAGTAALFEPFTSLLQAATCENRRYFRLLAANLCGKLRKSVRSAASMCRSKATPLTALPERTASAAD